MLRLAYKGLFFFLIGEVFINCIEETLDDTLISFAISENVFKGLFTYISFLNLFFFLFWLIEIDAPLLKACLTNLFPLKFLPLIPKKILFFFVNLESIEALLIFTFLSIFFFIISEIIFDFQFLFKDLFLTLINFSIHFLSEKNFLLPRTFCYFDDLFLADYCLDDSNGEPLAISEFNKEFKDLKLGKFFDHINDFKFPLAKGQIYTLHDLNNVDYEKYIGIFRLSYSFNRYNW